MLKTLDAVNEMSVVVNGVDSPNLMSVDSTEPVPTKVDDVGPSEKEIEKEKTDAPKEEEEKTDVEDTGKEEEEVEVKPKSKTETGSESDSPAVVKRIGKLTKKMRTAERERDFEREKRLEVEAKLKELSSKTPDVARPSKEDFDDEDDYIEALTDWKIDSKLKASQKDAEQEVAVEGERKDYVETFNGLDDAMDRGKELYSDFAELTLNEDLILAPDVVHILLDTEIPEEIMYHLASNPDESERISGLDPIRIAKEIGKIEVKLTKSEVKEVKPPKKQSKAPDPITPVRTTGTTEKDPSKMSAKEYRAWREKSK